MRRLCLLALALAACHRPSAPAPRDAGPGSVISHEILGRPVATARAGVRHVLIGWADPEGSAPRGQEPRAAGRSQAQAEALVREILLRSQGGEPFEQLMKRYSEDRGSAASGEIFLVRPDGALEPQFQALALRLQKGEVGVCRSAYGYHVVQRVE